MSVNNREIMLCETIEEQARLIADLKFQIQDLENKMKFNYCPNCGAKIVQRIKREVSDARTNK